MVIAILKYLDEHLDRLDLNVLYISGLLVLGFFIKVFYYVANRYSKRAFVIFSNSKSGMFL